MPTAVERVQMDFDLVEEMIKALRASADKMKTMEGVLRRVAQMLDDGAFVNEQGARWAEGLRNNIAPGAARGHDVFQELADDVQGALVDLRDGDTQAASRFKG